jgi:alpha-beta hydrolase superfamily lysophospholipase
MTITATTPDGASLCVREWVPEETAWLHLLLVHGLAEHAGRYERVGRQLAEAGILVRAFDLRGHGRSSGRRGDVEDWTDLTGDVGRMLADMRSTREGTPVALMGHSVGGLIALDAVLSGAATPDLLVLSAPAIGDDLPRWQHAVVPLLARVRPTMTLANGWDGSALSRDPGVAEAVAADPLQLGGASARLGAGGFAAQDRVGAGLEELHVPTLVTHGGDDRLVPPRATEPLGRVAGVTRVLYPDLRHETLFEPEGPEVVADMVAWLREGSRTGR